VAFILNPEIPLVVPLLVWLLLLNQKYLAKKSAHTLHGAHV